MALIQSQKEEQYIVNNTKTKTLHEITYVALGDSLTAGVGVENYVESYPYQIAQKISEKDKQQVNLKPYAVPGAKTNDVLPVLLEKTIKAKPDIVTVLLGVNDIHDRMSEDDFYSNYKVILERLTKETDAQIYVIAIPYIGAPNLILPPHSSYFNKQTRSFNKVLEKLVEEYPVNYIDLYTTTLEYSKKKEYYATDLFHPSYLGYTLWAQIIYDAFNK